LHQSEELKKLLLQSIPNATHRQEFAQCMQSLQESTFDMRTWLDHSLNLPSITGQQLASPFASLRRVSASKQIWTAKDFDAVRRSKECVTPVLSGDLWMKAVIALHFPVNSDTVGRSGTSDAAENWSLCLTIWLLCRVVSLKA
jgi:hypothetical protein